MSNVLNKGFCRITHLLESLLFSLFNWAYMILAVTLKLKIASREVMHLVASTTHIPNTSANNAVTHNEVEICMIFLFSFWETVPSILHRITTYFSMQCGTVINKKYLKFMSKGC